MYLDLKHKQNITNLAEPLSLAYNFHLLDAKKAAASAMSSGSPKSPSGLPTNLSANLSEYKTVKLCYNEVNQKR